MAVIDGNPLAILARELCNVFYDNDWAYLNADERESAKWLRVAQHVAEGYQLKPLGTHDDFWNEISETEPDSK